MKNIVSAFALEREKKMRLDKFLKVSRLIKRPDCGK